LPASRHGPGRREPSGSAAGRRPRGIVRHTVAEPDGLDARLLGARSPRVPGRKGGRRRRTRTGNRGLAERGSGRVRRWQCSTPRSMRSRSSPGTARRRRRHGMSAPSGCRQHQRSRRRRRRSRGTPRSDRRSSSPRRDCHGRDGSGVRSGCRAGGCSAVRSAACAGAGAGFLRGEHLDAAAPLADVAHAAHSPCSTIVHQAQLACPSHCRRCRISAVRGGRSSSTSASWLARMRLM
jgi:hypothetical protein